MSTTRMSATAQMITQTIARCGADHYTLPDGANESGEVVCWALSDAAAIATARDAGDLSMAMIDACLTDETGNGICTEGCYWALADLLDIKP